MVLRGGGIVGVQGILFSNGPDAGFDSVWNALRTIRAPFITLENDLQGLIAETLDHHGIVYEREVKLGPRNRIDFLTPSGTGIEVKKGKPNNTQLNAQVERYCGFDAVTGVIVVTPWSRHLFIPDTVHDKPVRVLSLNRLWGISL